MRQQAICDIIIMTVIPDLGKPGTGSIFLAKITQDLMGKGLQCKITVSVAMGTAHCHGNSIFMMYGKWLAADGLGKICGICTAHCFRRH